MRISELNQKDIAIISDPTSSAGGLKLSNIGDDFSILPTRTPNYFQRVERGLTEQSKQFAEGFVGGVRQAQAGVETGGIRGATEFLSGVTRSGLRTAGAVARGLFVPVFEAPGIKQATEFVIGKAMENEQVRDVVRDITDLAVKYPNATKDLHYFFYSVTLSDGPKVSGVVGREVGAIRSDISQAAKLALTPSEEVVQKNVVNLFKKSIKPAKTSFQQGKRYDDRVVNALKTIKSNADNITIENTAGEIIQGTPTTIIELNQALDQTKKIVFNQYDNLAKTAGRAGAIIDISPVVSELDTLVKNRALNLTNPEVIRYAENWATRLKELGSLDAETSQAVLQNLNNGLKAFYRNPTYESASKATIDAGIANNLRKSLDDVISKETGQEYQVLRSQYAALKAIEDDVVRAATREARKNARGLLDYTDIFTSGQMIGGLMSLNPSMFAKGAVERGIKEYIKLLNDPNRAIENMFRKLIVEPAPPFTPQSRLFRAFQEGDISAGLSIKAIGSTDNLTTKFLSYVDAKIAKNPNATISRQEILDFARRPELKKGEADLLNKLGNEVQGKSVPAQDFADSIRRDLLELKPVKVKEPQYTGVTIDDARMRESGLGNEGGYGRNYEEVVFESPITTNGSSHYPNSKNYFAHARGDEVVEGGKKIWREQEIQSDALQKEGIEKLREDQVGEMIKGVENTNTFWEDLSQNQQGYMAKENALPRIDARLRELRAEEPGFKRDDNIKKLTKFRNELINNAPEKPSQKFLTEEAQNKKEIDQLSPFTNDRFGERIMRERIREKAQKGYSKYRLPTGETIGRIEGFEANRFIHRLPDGRLGSVVEENTLKVGDAISNGGNANDFIVTEVLDNGRFKAVLKRTWENNLNYSVKNAWVNRYESIRAKKILSGEETPTKADYDLWGDNIETFDLTGKSNPQYRRYENWGKFLKNKYGGKVVTDPQGNSWVEIDLKPEYKKMPIEAFGVVPFIGSNGKNQ